MSAGGGGKGAAGDDAPQPRRRGRPPKGDPVLVRLGAHERQVAETLGGGVVAEGIRLALVAAGRIGIDAVQLLAQEPKKGRAKKREG
jgi:hypothetical protein